MYEGEVFEGLGLGDEVLERTIYEDCRFVRCRFEGTAWSEGRLSDCTFERCDLVGVRFVDTILQEVTFEHGRAMGTDFTGLRRLSLKLRFTDVKLDLSNFAGLPLSGTRFVDCSLREVVFDGCDLRSAAFSGSDLAGASLQHVKLAEADLRGTRSAVIDVTTCALSDTRIDVGTALVALRDLGLRCEGLEQMFGEHDARAPEPRGRRTREP